MPFVDSDFILALIKEADWLKEKASKAYERYKGKLWTSGHVVAEILLISARLKLDPEKVVISTYRLVDVKGMDEATALLAAHYIKEKNVNLYDALHAAYAQFDEIMSSDSVFDELGPDRIKRICSPRCSSIFIPRSSPI